MLTALFCFKLLIYNPVLRLLTRILAPKNKFAANDAISKASIMSPQGLNLLPNANTHQAFYTIILFVY